MMTKYVKINYHICSSLFSDRRASALKTKALPSETAQKSLPAAEVGLGCEPGPAVMTPGRQRLPAERKTLSVRNLIHGDQDDIDDRPDAEPSQREQFQQPKPN